MTVFFSNSYFKLLFSGLKSDRTWIIRNALGFWALVHCLVFPSSSRVACTLFLSWTTLPLECKHVQRCSVRARKVCEKAFFVARSPSHVHLTLSPSASLSRSPSGLSLPVCSPAASSRPLGAETLSSNDLTPAHLVDFQSIRQGVMEACRKALTNRYE